MNYLETEPDQRDKQDASLLTKYNKTDLFHTLFICPNHIADAYFDVINR